MWEQQQAVAEWTGKTNAMENPLKKSTCILCIQDLVKRFVPDKGDAQWDCLLLNVGTA